MFPNFLQRSKDSSLPTMAAPWLPLEVLYLIFSFLDQPTLAKLMVSNSSLSDIAGKFLYSRLEFKSFASFERFVAIFAGSTEGNGKDLSSSTADVKFIARCLGMLTTSPLIDSKSRRQVRYLSWVKHIHLHLCPHWQPIDSYLSRILPYLKNVKSLVITAAEEEEVPVLAAPIITPTTFILLSQHLDQLRLLQVDSISNYISFTTSSLEKVMSSNSQMEKLLLSNTPAFSSANLTKVVSTLNQLSALEIEASAWVDQDFMLSLRRSCPNLTAVRFGDGTSICSTAFRILVESHPLLTSLTINSATLLQPSDFLRMAKCLPGLKHLGLSESLIDDSAVVGVVEKCRKLESLSLWQCESLTVEGIAKMSKNADKLQVLELGFCDAKFSYDDLLDRLSKGPTVSEDSTPQYTTGDMAQTFTQFTLTLPGSIDVNRKTDKLSETSAAEVGGELTSQFTIPAPMFPGVHSLPTPPASPGWFFMPSLKMLNLAGAETINPSKIDGFVKIASKFSVCGGCFENLFIETLNAESRSKVFEYFEYQKLYHRDIRFPSERRGQSEYVIVDGVHIRLGR
ncbi:hypothetical protein BKA69DRAFT_213931 [Paraphysoderma sedebokerense]|nr:hypothetical protein BKA69DRAFT_213931 [Paraphysoderma sedebokerense]